MPKKHPPSPNAAAPSVKDGGAGGPPLPPPPPAGAVDGGQRAVGEAPPVARMEEARPGVNRRKSKKRSPKPANADLPDAAGDIDPALEAFLSEAAPILARERGINAKSRVLLGALARNVGLPDDQFEQAVLALQRSPDNGQKAGSLWEDAFYRVLGVTFDRLPQPILSPAVESRAIKLGVEKYELAPHQAEELIARVAREKNVQRIGRETAAKHMRGMIGQVLGDSTWLADESADRLRQSGSQWGLEPVDVDRLIREQTEANRGREKGEGRIVWFAFGGVGVAVLLLVGLFVWILLIRPMMIVPEESEGDAAGGALMAGGDDGSSSAGANGEGAGGGAATRRPQSDPARWWDEELQKRQVAARVNIPGYRAAYEQSAAADPAQRERGYRDVVAAVQLHWENKVYVELLRQIAVMTILLEPDEKAAQSLIDGLFDLAAINVESLPTESDAYAQAVWSIDTALAALDEEGLADERAKNLLGPLGHIAGRGLSRPSAAEDLRPVVMEGLFRSIYAQLTAAAADDPNRAAGLLRQVSGEAAKHLDAETASRLEIDLLAALLENKSFRWREHQTIIESNAYTKDPVSQLRLVSMYETASDPVLQDFLGKLLMRLIDVPAELTDPEDIAAAMREELGAVIPAPPVTGRDRWEKLRPLVAESLAAARAGGTPQERLARTIEHAWLATLAAALSRQEAGFDLFDELWEGGPPKLADGDTGAARRAPDERDADDNAPLPETHQSKMEGFLLTIGRYRTRPFLDRQTAVRGLARDAARFREIRPQEATPLAEYLLWESKQPAEQEHVLESLAMVAEDSAARDKWRYILLAVVDGLETSALPADEVRRLAAILLRRDDLPAVTSEADRRSLASALTRDVWDELKSRKSVTTSAANEYDLAARLLQEQYSNRGRALGVPIDASAAGPADVQRQLIEHQAAMLGAAATPWLMQEMLLADYLGESGVARTAALQRVQLKLLEMAIERNLRDRSRQAKQIRQSLTDRDLKAESATAQLRDGEAAILAMWMLHGPQE